MDTADYTVTPTPSELSGGGAPVASAPARQATPRVLPISSLRFILAAVVVVGHAGSFPFFRDAHHGLLWAARALSNIAFDGPAAVIVFFVISGFCIHFPNRSGLTTPSWRAYYARRYIRILIPMTVAIVLSLPLHFSFGLFNSSILWSLLCEEIYYFLYPGILAVQRRLGWRWLLTIAGLLSLCVILTNPGTRNYTVYGPGLNWLLGLPCWLLGCHLAARFDVIRLRNVGTRQIWAWRLGAWALSVIVQILTFHTPIGSPWSLNLFAIYGVLWLEREIAFYRNRPAPWFEQAGEASYSVYLVHVHGFSLAELLGVEALGAKAAWVVMLMACGVFAALFYVAVERPAHKLARRLGRAKIARPASVTAPG